MAIIPTHGWKPENKPKRDCFAYAHYIELQGTYGDRVRLICPLIWKKKGFGSPWHYRLPTMPREAKSKIAQSAWRIFTVTNALATMSLNEDTIALWACVRGLLDSYFDSICRDLQILPICLREKGCAREATQCEEAFDELRSAADDYSRAPVSGKSAYLMPPQEVLDNPTNDVDRALRLIRFRDWRADGILRRKLAGLESEIGCFARMSNTFPARLAIAASKVTQVVRPILDAFSDEAEATKVTGPAGPPPEKKTRGKWSTKSTRKKPDQLFKEARERSIANKLSEAYKTGERISCYTLAKALQCSPSTITRSKAWNKHRSMSDYPEPPNGSKNPEGDEGPHIEARNYR